MMQSRKLRVLMLWSGGIDSTALFANLLAGGCDVVALNLGVYDHKAPRMAARERAARAALLPALQRIARTSGAVIEYIEAPADFIWAFSPDGVEIPRRNRHMIDHMIEAHMKPRGLTHLGLGEYIGADTWVVRDHVGAADADARALQSYVYQEHGLKYRLWTLADFGESRYKADRLRLGWETLGSSISKATNCLMDTETACGECYKCCEREAAFRVLGLCSDDAPRQTTPPEDRVLVYMQQMQGEHTTRSHSEFLSAARKTHNAELEGATDDTDDDTESGA